MKHLFAFLVLILAACGGGGGGTTSTEAPWTSIPAFAITNDNSIGLLLPSTDARGANIGDGAQELECTITSRGYWASGGHLALILRYTPPPYPGLAGAGLAIGKVGRFVDNSGFLYIDLSQAPQPIIETWAPGAGMEYAPRPISGRDSILPQETIGPVLADATPYPTLVQMGVRGGKRFIRYTMAGFDSGEWSDPTTGNDITQTGILVTTSAHTDAPGMRADFDACRTRWKALS